MNVTIQEINGFWHTGYVLDKHIEKSEFLGTNESGRSMFDNTRTDVGESIYQLKYRNDYSQIPLLADVFVSNLQSKLESVSLIIPMPPSKHRSFQPLIQLAKSIAEKMDLPLFDNILIKNKKTAQMKDIPNNEDKMSILLDSFIINDTIQGDGPWDALIIDDLYSSGSSLNAATIKLQNYFKIRNIYVAAFTRTK